MKNSSWARGRGSASVAFFLSLLLSLVYAAGCDGRGNGNPDGGGGGECRLPTEEEACFEHRGQGLPFVIEGNSMGRNNFEDASCGGARAPDYAFTWTTEDAGFYTISLEGSTFDTVLHVRRGAACGGEEIACNDDIVMGMNIQSAVKIPLGACETITIVIDGFGTIGGDYHLEITREDIADTETFCVDGFDNDNDGLTDLEDPDCETIPCPAVDDWDPAWHELECGVLLETNRYRSLGYNCDTEGNFGPAGPLEMDNVVRPAARMHSMDMGMQGYFDHTALDGRSPFDRMRDVGFTGAQPWGENIAAGQTSAAEVTLGWMESDGHCANIMNPDYNVIGIGYGFVSGSPYGHYWTQNFAASH